MAKPFDQWTVLPHGALTRLDDNLLSVTGVMHMPMGEVERRMTVARLSDGRLVIYSAIALDEPQMREIEAFGTPAFLIVPNDIHRMDAKIWKDRYPGMTVVTSRGALEKVNEVVPVDTTRIDFDDPSVRFVTVPGTGEGEAALVVETASGTTLILADLLFNLENRPGFKGWLLKVIGMTGEEPHLPPLVKMRRVKDARALRAQLVRWSRLPHLNRLVVAHGNIITSDPAGVLRRTAKDIAA